MPQSDCKCYTTNYQINATALEEPDLELLKAMAATAVQDLKNRVAVAAPSDSGKSQNQASHSHQHGQLNSEDQAARTRT